MVDTGQVFEHSGDVILPLVHAQRRALCHEGVVIAIDGETREQIALGVHQTQARGLWIELFPTFERPRQPLLDKRVIHVVALVPCQ